MKRATKTSLAAMAIAAALTSFAGSVQAQDSTEQFYGTSQNLSLSFTCRTAHARASNKAHDRWWELKRLNPDYNVVFQRSPGTSCECQEIQERHGNEHWCKSTVTMRFYLDPK